MISYFRRHFPSVGFAALFLGLIAALGGIFISAGIYNIGADAPHSMAVHGLLREVRENSIAHHSRDIETPKDLSDPKRIEAGAGLYQEMCTGCHRGPGVAPSEMSQGLYPPAPDLATANGRPAAQQFWIIKHGVKFSAMPAWGKTHNDQLLWNMVAFIRQLRRMSPEQYRAAITSAPASHDEMMEGMQRSDGHDIASRQHTHSHSAGTERHGR